MRIGELAALVGVSTRTVRHYHRLGLLTEPVRLTNGYRDYRLRDAVELARVRRLAELGLSLDEIRRVLAGDRGRDLREVLQELDADLARQQEAIGARRRRLAELLTAGHLHPDAAVSPAMASVLGELTGGGSAFAGHDREMLTMLDTATDPAGREALSELFRPLTEPGAQAETEAIYARLDELATAEVTDPRVAELAADLAAHLPAELATAMVESLGNPETAHWMGAVSEEFSPAQAETFRQLITILTTRS
jgi:DNA-binding transcriptional MerR regulator